MDEKKTKKLPAEYDFEKILLENFNFSPSELNELNDILENTSSLINSHMETTASFTEETKRTIIDLSLKQDSLTLEINELYIIAEDFLKKVKKNKYFGTEIQKDEQKIEQFHKKLGHIETGLFDLIKEIRDYLNLVQKQRPF